MRVPSFHPLRVGSSPAHPGYPLPLLWVHRASQEPLSAWARSPDITPDKLHGEGKNQLGGERLGIYSGSRKAGRWQLCPGKRSPSSAGPGNKVRGPSSGLRPRSLFVGTAEQLFKQGAWGSSIFLTKCPPPLGPGREGRQVQGPRLELAPSPRGLRERPTDVRYRWSGEGPSPYPGLRDGRQWPAL